MPSEFGKYLLQRKLAEGGMAEVFLAKQSGMEGFEKPVVVKRILPHLGSDQRFIDMFVHEARVAARLSHPAIVQIFDLGKVDDQYFIAMEFIHGEDLRTIAKHADQLGRRPPLPLLVRIVADMLGGLHYAHTRAGPDGKPLGLVHRDISPQNVLVTYEGGVKLVDFGIAKATQSHSDQQTQAGLLKGKFAYMSPEQCRGKKLDARSDVFTVGILLWELVTWRRLFRRDSDLATLVAVADEPIPPISSVLPEVPPELDMICMRALARPLDERYPSAQAMQNDLEALVRKYGWAADSIRLQHYMHDLFSDKIKAQDEAVRAAGVASLEDLLVKEDGLKWMEPIFQSNRTPAINMQPSGAHPGTFRTPTRGIPLPTYYPAGGGAVVSPMAHQPSAPVVVQPVPGLPAGTPSAAMRVITGRPTGGVPIQPVPGLPSGPLAVAGGVIVQPPPGYPSGPAPAASEVTPSTMRHAVGQSVAHAPPPVSGLRRVLIVGLTSVVVAGGVIGAALFSGGEATPAAPLADSATVHLVLDADAQIYLDGVRQLPGRETDLQVSARREHELRVKRGDVERKVTIPALDAGVIHALKLSLKEE